VQKDRMVVNPLKSGLRGARVQQFGTHLGELRRQKQQKNKGEGQRGGG
jgi:hypothetical protein